MATLTLGTVQYLTSRYVGASRVFGDNYISPTTSFDAILVLPYIPETAGDYECELYDNGMELPVVDNNISFFVEFEPQLPVYYEEELKVEVEDSEPVSMLVTGEGFSTDISQKDLKQEAEDFIISQYKRRAT